MNGVQDSKVRALKSQGYSEIGVVLYKDGEYCIVDQGAVRWLTKDEHRKLMHPQHNEEKSNDQ